MDGVDTNLDNYSIDDLFQIMGLEPDSSPEQIHNNANTTIARMTSEGKPDMAMFLENVKKKLLTEASMDDDTEEEDDGGEDDGTEDDGTEDDGTEDDGTEDDGTEEEDDGADETKKAERKEDTSKKDANAKEDEDLVNSFFNQERTRNVTQVISFDTRFRPNYYGTTSTSFTIDLPEVQKKVVSMRIASIEMPMTQYSVSPRLENNSMLVVCEDTSYSTSESFKQDSVPYQYNNDEPASDFHSEAEKKAWLVKLTDGNYDTTWYSDTLLSRTENMMNDALSLAKPGAIDATGTFARFSDPSNNYLNSLNVRVDSIGNPENPNGDLRYTIDRISKKSVFACGRTSGPYTDTSSNLLKISELRFNVDGDGNVDTTANIQSKLGWTLGFRGAEYKMGADPIETGIPISAVSEGVPFLSGTRYAFLSINDYQNNARPSFLVAYGDSTKTDNIMARINLAYGQNLHQRDGAFTHNSNRTREYFGPVDIQRLTIQLKDEFGRIIDLNNMDWSFTLAFEKKFK
jgi:hypothetical protein